MKKALSILFFATLFATVIEAQTQKVTVEIDFGGIKPNKTFQTEWYDGMTAMTALQSCTTIESYPIKTYVFVSTINGVRNERGAKAWYYTVNDENTGKISFRYEVKPGDSIRWIYKKDVCSGTVDKKCDE